MCGGGGQEVIDDIVSGVSGAVEGISGGLSGGLFSLDLKDGKFNTEAVGSAIKSGVKDVTGASAAEKAQKDAAAQIEAERAAALKDREDAKGKLAADQLQASRTAGGVKTRASSARVSRFTGNLGTDEEDFLGL